uniref:Uncharacterized protein n=1 Tax=Peronospora matthiolae TaxID=2874970 RepID=A0AAV1UX73_9STRA
MAPHTTEHARLLPTKASPSPRRPYRSIILSVCSFILVTEFCERLAYYGLSGSLPIFFHRNLGLRGIKPNVVVLGADQFDVSIPAQRAEKDSFFNWFYWAINIGATFSYGVLTNLAVNGLPALHLA